MGTKVKSFAHGPEYHTAEKTSNTGLQDSRAHRLFTVPQNIILMTKFLIQKYSPLKFFS